MVRLALCMALNHPMILNTGDALRAIDRASGTPKLRTYGAKQRSVNDAPTAPYGTRKPMDALASKAPSLQGVSRGVSGDAMARHLWIVAGRPVHPIFSRAAWLEANTYNNLLLPTGADRLCFGCGYHDYCRCDKPKFAPDVVARVPKAPEPREANAPKVPEPRFYTRHGVPVF